MRWTTTAPGVGAAVWALAVALVSDPACAEDDIFVSFEDAPIAHAASGLVVDRLPDARGIRVRNEKHEFRLTLPDSDWTFRSDRWPLEVTDTEYFITAMPVGGSGRSPTSPIDWNYHTCIDTLAGMIELHVVRQAAPEGPPTGSHATVAGIIRSLQSDPP